MVEQHQSETPYLNPSRSTARSRKDTIGAAPTVHAAASVTVAQVGDAKVANGNDEDNAEADADDADDDDDDEEGDVDDEGDDDA